MQINAFNGGWSMLGQRQFINITFSAAVLALSGCESARFYGQAISGQVGLLSSRTSVERVIANEATTPELRSNLQRVQILKAFGAEHLGLESEGSYDSYVALDRSYVAWNVAVCDEFSLTPKSWWYPIVGRLEHRGYFREKGARRYAQKMRDRGKEVAIGGVPAYSTLGWFNDPILSAFWHLSEVELAELLFHELAHQEVFIVGDTDFNEAFAVAVGEEGVIRWLKAQEREKELMDYLESLRVQQAFMDWVLGLRRSLAALYEQGEREEWADAERRRKKEDCIQLAREDFLLRVESSPKLGDYSAWVESPINNAKISVLDTYYRLLPLFRRRLQQESDLSAVYQWMEELKDQSKKERVTLLQRSVQLETAEHDES